MHCLPWNSNVRRYQTVTFQQVRTFLALVMVMLTLMLHSCSGSAAVTVVWGIWSSRALHVCWIDAQFDLHRSFDLPRPSAVVLHY